MIRRAWRQLPEQVRHEVVRRCGPVLRETRAPAGRHSAFSATLHMAGGRVFVKGIQVDHPQASGHRHEAYVSSWLPATAPRLLWTVEAAGWLMLGFEHLTGRHADMAPESPDLPLIAYAVTTISATLTPCPIEHVPALADQWARLSAWRRLRQDPPTDLCPWSLDNLDRFVAIEHQAVDAVAGPSLTHTDLHSLNLIINRSAHVVDWAWSRRAAPWVDTGFVILRLIESGHSPVEAERWAADIPIWTSASAPARTMFAIAVLGIWEFLQRDQPLPHRPRLTDAARRWSQYRIGRSGI